MKVYVCMFRWSISISITVTILLAGIATNSFAGSSSGQDALNVTNSNTQILNQVSGVGAGARRVSDRYGDKAIKSGFPGSSGRLVAQDYSQL